MLHAHEGGAVSGGCGRVQTLQSQRQRAKGITSAMLCSMYSWSWAEEPAEPNARHIIPGLRSGDVVTFNTYNRTKRALWLLVKPATESWGEWHAILWESTNNWGPSSHEVGDYGIIYPDSRKWYLVPWHEAEL